MLTALSSLGYPKGVSLSLETPSVHLPRVAGIDRDPAPGCLGPRWGSRPAPREGVSDEDRAGRQQAWPGVRGSAHREGEAEGPESHCVQPPGRAPLRPIKP